MKGGKKKKGRVDLTRRDFKGKEMVRWGYGMPEKNKTSKTLASAGASKLEGKFTPAVRGRNHETAWGKDLLVS